MKIQVCFKDATVLPVVIDELLFVKVGNAILENEKLESIPLNQDAQAIFAGKNQVLTARVKDILYFQLVKD